MSRDLISLGERIAEHAAHLDAAMHRLLSDLREFDQGGGWHAQGARSCAHWLSWRVGWDLGTAREHVRVAGKLAELPRIDQALEHGELSYSKVRAMTRVATVENEATILEMARVSPAHQLEKICRKYAIVQRHDSDVRPEDDVQRRYVTRRDTADGMVRIEAVLHPEEAALVWAALDHVAKQQCRESQHIPAEVSADAATDTATIEGNAGQDPPHISAETASDPAAFERYSQQPRCVSAEVLSVVHALERPVGEARRASQDLSAETISTVLSLDDSTSEACGESRFVPAGTCSEVRHSKAAAGPAFEDQPDPEQSGRTGHRRHAKGAARSSFDRADALVAIAQAHVRGDRPDRSPIEVVVTVEATTLVRTSGINEADTDADTTNGTNEVNHAGDPSAVACFRDGTCVSPETARRLCCDAGIVEMAEDERGNPLSVGRKTRTIPGSMKRALLQRDQTCRFPGCTNRVFLEGHHIEHWADGGETKLDNILAICTHHHRFVHEYGYRIELGSDGPRFHDKHGRPILDAPAPPRMASIGWDAILSCNADLEITARTNECAWDGGPVHYVDAIDHLVRADRLE